MLLWVEKSAESRPVEPIETHSHCQAYSRKLTCGGMTKGAPFHNEIMGALQQINIGFMSVCVRVCVIGEAVSTGPRGRLKDFCRNPESLQQSPKRGEPATCTCSHGCRNASNPPQSLRPMIKTQRRLRLELPPLMTVTTGDPKIERLVRILAHKSEFQLASIASSGHALQGRFVNTLSEDGGNCLLLGLAIW